MNFEQMERLFSVVANRASTGSDDRVRQGRRGLTNSSPVNGDLNDRRKHSDEVSSMSRLKTLYLMKI